jgi:hypothetical protein
MLLEVRNALDPIEKFTDWEQFQSLTSDLISPSIQIHSSEEDDKAACDFAVSIILPYRLSTRKTTILDWKYELPGSAHLLKHKNKLRKWWQETRDPTCKTAVKLLAEWPRKEHLNDGKQR